MDELLSRKEVLDLWDKFHPYIATYAMQFDEKLRELKPVEPQRMKATWISKVALQDGQITLMDYKCSNCSHHRGKPMNFCEVCGAKMER